MMHKLPARCMIASALGALGALPMHAQQAGATLSGRVLLPDSVTAAVGVVVEAVRPSDPSARARVLSGADGEFTLRLAGGGTWQVNAMRIGYVPTPLGSFTLADGEFRHLERPVVVSGTAVNFTLAALEIHEDEICGRSDESSQLLIATLLAQARTALAATVLTQADGRATAAWQRFGIYTDRLGTPVSPMRVSRFTSATDRPFGSVSTDSLMRRGYYWDIGGSMQFHAPDAEVLLSEQFIGSHCYQVSPPHPERPDWIGVAFAPAERRRDVVEVQGTLWLDRESAELRRLDFGYTDLPGRIGATNPRGAVEFLRLPTDIWVVSWWELRLPRSELVRVRSGDTPSPVAPQINLLTIAGGSLTSVHRGAQQLFGSPQDPSQRFPALSARIGMAPVCMDAPEPNAADAGVLIGSVVDSLGNPVSATVRISWTGFGRSRAVNFDEERYVTATSGTYIACGLTLGKRLRVTALARDGRTSEEIVTRLRAPDTWAALDLSVP